MRELEDKGQSEITECNRKIDLLKSEQEKQSKAMTLNKEQYQLQLNQNEQLKHEMENLKETNAGLLDDIVKSNNIIEEQTLQMYSQEEKIEEKSKLMEEQQKNHKRNQMKSKHENFMLNANSIVKSKNAEKQLFLHKFIFDLGEIANQKLSTLSLNTLQKYFIQLLSNW